MHVPPVLRGDRVWFEDGYAAAPWLGGWPNRTFADPPNSRPSTASDSPEGLARAGRRGSIAIEMTAAPVLCAAIAVRAQRTTKNIFQKVLSPI